MMRWGLVPFWATDMSIGSRMINARSEEASVKPAFRAAFRSKRCIVPVSGFYEWKKLGEGQRKQPYYLRPPGGGIFAFAGLWESWRGGSLGVDAELLTFTILTTRANESVAPIHDRMPVVLSDEGGDRWLDPSTPAAELQQLLVPAPEGSIEAYTVATRVNSPANDAPDLIEPAAA
jgi:putative SOS response-associated peptidase YedK